MFLAINVLNNWKAKKMHCTEVQVQSNFKGNFHFATMSEWKSTSGVRDRDPQRNRSEVLSLRDWGG